MNRFAPCLMSAEIEYKIVEKTIVRWFFFNKTKYWVETEFARTGPFDTRAEAEEILSYAKL